MPRQAASACARGLVQRFRKENPFAFSPCRHTAGEGAKGFLLCSDYSCFPNNRPESPLTTDSVALLSVLKPPLKTESIAS